MRFQTCTQRTQMTPLRPTNIHRRVLTEPLTWTTPPYSLTADAVRFLRVGLPVSTTRFADTESVSTASAVSTGVDSECPTPTSSRPRERIFHDAFASLSASNPHDGHECSRTQSGLFVSVPHDAHSLVVPRGSTATKCVPSRSHLYSSIRRNVPHDAPARFWELPGSSINPFASKSSTATRSYSRA